MRLMLTAMCVTQIYLGAVGSAWALPQLEEPVELPADFNGIVTIYPDNHNTTEVRYYWLVPSIARIVRRQDGKLAFGLVHSGISSYDPSGVQALLTLTTQPYVDDATLQRAKTLIEQQAKANGAKQVGFRYISPTETTMRLLIGGQYYDWSGKDHTTVMGGSVDAGIPFQIRLKDSFDVRALAQAGGDDASTIGVLYTMKFDGVRNRCDFDVTANFRETYEHFKTQVTASGWFGLARANASVEWQKLLTTGAVKLTVRQCRQTDLDKYDWSKVMNSFLDQLTTRTGFFSRQLKANGLPDAPGGGGAWGWSIGVGGGFESYEQTTELKYAVDVQYTVSEEIAFGMSFPSGGAELKRYVRNITDTSKPFPTSDDFKRASAEHKVCRANNIAALDELLKNGTINQDLHDRLIEKALTKGCYVDYSLVRLSQLLHLPEARDGRSLTRELTRETELAPSEVMGALLDPEGDWVR